MGQGDPKCLSKFIWVCCEETFEFVVKQPVLCMCISISWLCYCFIVLQDVAIGWNLVKGAPVFLYYSLQPRIHLKLSPYFFFENQGTILQLKNSWYKLFSCHPVNSRLKHWCFIFLRFLLFCRGGWCWEVVP